ncbi:MAG TPA: hypothetical protein VH593_26400 [Ktedonobacteraceae bacterium]|jgi:hypothetical protein
MVTVTLASWPAWTVCVGGLAARQFAEAEGALWDDVAAALATPAKSKVRVKANAIARTGERLNNPDEFLLMLLNLSFSAKVLHSMQTR